MSNNIVLDYFELCAHYQDLYGAKTIVLLTVGSFYEIYSLIHPQTKLIPDHLSPLTQVADICSLNIATKSNTLGENTKHLDAPIPPFPLHPTPSEIKHWLQMCPVSNIQMAGFRDYSLEKYVDRLVQGAGYTVVEFVQNKDSNTGTISRVLHQIYSPGTYLSNSLDVSESNSAESQKNSSNSSHSVHIMSIWCEHIRTKQYYVFGMAVANVTSGQMYSYEFETVPHAGLDQPNVLDELERILTIYQPREIVVVFPPVSGTGTGTTEPEWRKTLVTSMETLSSSSTNPKIHVWSGSGSGSQSQKIVNATKPVYIQEFFTRVYPQISNYHEIQAFHNHPISLYALVILLDALQGYSPQLLKQLKLPIFGTSCVDGMGMERTQTNVVLSNRTLQQLNMVSTGESGDSGGGAGQGVLGSVLSFLDKTQTPMGRRKMRFELLHPKCHPQELEDQYQTVADFQDRFLPKLDSQNQKTPNIQELRNLLKGVADLDKIGRLLVKSNPGSNLNPNSPVNFPTTLIQTLWRSLTAVQDIQCWIHTVGETQNGIFSKNPNPKRKSDSESCMDLRSSSNTNASKKSKHDDSHVFSKYGYEEGTTPSRSLSRSFFLNPSQEISKILEFLESKFHLGTSPNPNTPNPNPNVLEESELDQENTANNGRVGGGGSGGTTLGSFLKSNVCPHLESHLRRQREFQATLQTIKQSLETILGTQENTLKLHETEKMGYSLQLTKKRARTLKLLLDNGHKQPPLVFQDASQKIQIPLTEIKLRNASSNYDEIEFRYLTDITKDMVFLKESIRTVEQEAYRRILAELESRFLPKIVEISHEIAQLDVLVTKAFVAREFHYCRPVIPGVVVPGAGGGTPAGGDDDIPQENRHENRPSFLKCTELRHPLIEHIQTQEIYKAHTLHLGHTGGIVSSDTGGVTSKDPEGLGIVVAGFNGVGKTSLIRSVGIAVLMAQAGWFVPATSFEFQPYHSIFCHIEKQDNLFRNLSTFQLEMSLIRGILNQANSRTLVLGDELLNSTEYASGLSLMTAFLEDLCSPEHCQASFLIATHYNQLGDLIEFQHLMDSKKLQAKHMATHYDLATGKLVLDRTLRVGLGPKSYGIEVSRSLGLPPVFLERARCLRDKYFFDPQDPVSPLEQSTSKYSSQVLTGGVCALCGGRRGTEIHHVLEQKQADAQGFIRGAGGVHKNHPANLKNVCEICHLKIHHHGSKV